MLKLTLATGVRPLAASPSLGSDHVQQADDHRPSPPPPSCRFGRHRQLQFHVAEHLGVTFNGANSLVSKFCDLGLLEEITGGARRRRFAYDPCISLLRTGTERPEK